MISLRLTSSISASLCSSSLLGSMGDWLFASGIIEVFLSSLVMWATPSAFFDVVAWSFCLGFGAVGVSFSFVFESIFA